MKEMGMWVSLEGIDAVGKTFQVPRVASLLREKQDRPVVTVPEFSNTPVGQLIKNVIETDRFIRLAPDGSTPLSESLLLFTDRLLNIETIIAPAISEGKMVVSDRGLLSPLAYQSQIIKDLNFGGSERDALKWLLSVIQLFPLTPNLNILLSAPIETIDKRLIQRGEPPLDQDGREFLQNVDRVMRHSYHLIPGKTVVVHASNSVSEITSIITDLILKQADEKK